MTKHEKHSHRIGPALSLRYKDGLCFRRGFLATLYVIKDKVMAGGTPANPATPVLADLGCLILGKWLRGN